MLVRLQLPRADWGRGWWYYYRHIDCLCFVCVSVKWTWTKELRRLVDKEIVPVPASPENLMMHPGVTAILVSCPPGQVLLAVSPDQP